MLVIDDDARIRKLIGQYLTDQGFVVMLAEDAAQARLVMAGFLFDVLVVDVMMPGETGMDFVRELRGRSDIPVLMLTALGEVEDRIDGLQAGADDYLPKPFEPKELALRLEALVRRTRKVKARGKKLRLGRWVVDLERQELAEESGAVQALTATEITLLSSLAERSGAPISREELALLCGVAGNERTIDVQVTRLRRKIEENSRQPLYLKTVRGQGYVLHVDEVL